MRLERVPVDDALHLRHGAAHFDGRRFDGLRQERFGLRLHIGIARERRFTLQRRCRFQRLRFGQPLRFGLEPPTTHFFGVDAEADYLLPVVVGDRLCRRGALLLSCKPKETRVGQGAFISWQTEVINQRRERVPC